MVSVSKGQDKWDIFGRNIRNTGDKEEVHMSISGIGVSLVSHEKISWPAEMTISDAWQKLILQDSMLVFLQMMQQVLFACLMSFLYKFNEKI